MSPVLLLFLEAELNIPTLLWNPLQAIQQYADIKIDLEQAEIGTLLDEYGDTLAVPLGVAFKCTEPDIRGLLATTGNSRGSDANSTTTSDFCGPRDWQFLIIGGVFFGGLHAPTDPEAESGDGRAGDSQVTHNLSQLRRRQLGRELALTEMLVHNISPLDILHALSEMFRDRNASRMDKFQYYQSQYT